MSDIRDMLRRGVGGFAPDPEEGYDVLLRLLRRRRSKRRLEAGILGVLVFGGTVGAFWASVQLGSAPQPGGSPDATVAPSDATTSPPPTVVPTGTAAVPGTCDYGPWFEECPEAVWATEVREEAGLRPLGNTDATLIAGTGEGGRVLFWAMDPDLHGQVQPATEEVLSRGGFRPFGVFSGVPVSTHGRLELWAWRAQGLNVWVRTETSPGPGRDDIDRLVRASKAIPYDPQPVVCDLPGFRPTYLPWLAPAEPVPEPEVERTAHGGGPQDMDPGYSLLSWGSGSIRVPGGPKHEGGVTLWRTTESVGVLRADPAVPPLPNGAEGRLYYPETGDGGDWAIIWVDPFPDTQDDPCSETTLSTYFPQLTKEEGQREIVKIARSLVAT
jgi:hypothetical protein